MNSLNQIKNAKASYYVIARFSGVALIKRGGLPPRGRLALALVATLALLSCDFFDIFPPEIEIVSPKEGTSYFATLPIELKATDNRRVDKVEVFVNGTSVHVFTKSPYKTDISLAGVSNPATLKAIAHDQAGNSAEASRDVNVTIGLRLTAPNGEESWAEQSTQSVTWESSGSVGSMVGLHYSTDGGSTWDEITTSTANDGAYAWTLPNFSETQSACKIRVSTDQYADESDDAFTISAEPNTLTLTSPNGGETWAEQSTQTVTWSYSGDVGDYVSLDYSLDGGSSWNEIIATTSNDGSHAWNITNFLDTQSACRVRVASTTTAFADTSNADFTITTEPNFISLTSPNGGEIWAEQSTQTILWTYGGDVGDYVSLHLSLDNGSSWNQIVASTPNDGSYDWSLPNLFETASTCLMRVNGTTTSFADTSAAAFTITAEPNYLTLTAPNGGETWAEQSTQTITWNKSGDVGDYVNLHYSLDGGGSWTQIVASTSNDGSHAWNIPNYLDTQSACRVKVASTSTAFADTSDANFTITGGEVTITSPNGGETWPEQSTQTITWNSSGDVGDNVSLYHSLDGGSTWTQITASTANDGSHYWTLPAVNQDETAYRVKVASTSTSYYDVSDGNFVIEDIPFSNIQKLLAPDAQADDKFGYSVALDGDYAIVGALDEDAGGTDAGAAYVFQRTGINSWDGGTKLTSPDAQADDKFGLSVAISGDYALVGVYNYNEDLLGMWAGAAYVFQRTGINSWDGGAKLTAPDAQAGDQFGKSVALSGDYAIIGAVYEDAGGNAAGAAYVFQRTGINSWDGGTKLTAPDAQAADVFGRSVALDGDYALVGASEAAYVFQRTGINSWDGGTKLTAPDAQAYDYFGYSVALDGDYALVGAYREDAGGTDAGAAYVFQRTGANSWDDGAKLTAPDAQAGDWFGCSVALDGDYALVGARYEDAGGSNAGAAYVFQRMGINSWDGGTKLTAPDAQADDWFGFSVALDGDYALVGAVGEDAGGSKAGAAYVFRR